MKKILIAGGSGLIGGNLIKMLTEGGFQVSLLSRSFPSATSQNHCYYWDPIKRVIPDESLVNQDIIINLAGLSIADKRWTKKRKKKILQSRVLSTQLLVQSIINNKLRPELFINASAVGYYASNPGVKITETSPPGISFLNQVCKQWEEQLMPLRTAGVNVAILRFGMVFSRSGGSFPKLIAPLKYGIYPIFGRGSQTIPWIHIDDLLAVVRALIKRELEATIYNIVSPNELTQREFNRIVLRIVHKRALKIRIPSKVLSVILGELSSVLLNDQAVVPEKLLNQKFRFIYPEADTAIAELLKID